MPMKESKYKTYADLPLFLNAKTVAEVLGVSPATSYELLHESDFWSLCGALRSREVSPTVSEVGTSRPSSISAYL